MIKLAANSKSPDKAAFMLLWIKTRFLISFVLFIIGSQFLTIFTFIPLPINKKRAKRFRENFLMWFARFINAISYNISIKIENVHKEKFINPAIIIANHVSILDVPLFLSLTSKIIIITNPELKHSRFEWILTKYANLYLISENVQESYDFLKEKIDNGYSILIFPEGARSPNKIRRFHKGAFMFADLFKIDILPVFIKAEGDFVENNSFFKHTGKINMHLLDRISPENKFFGSNFDERTKNICQYYRQLNSAYTGKITDAYPPYNP